MFDDFVQDNRDELVETLRSLLQIPSVKSNAVPGSPFGEGPSAALEYVLSIAEKRGFRVRNYDGYAGHVEYGEGHDYIAVLSHLDVVPPGNDWSSDPFAADVRDGLVFARGAIDDKGPAMSTLWALVALKELGIEPKRKIRLIFGLDEEADWNCVRYYFEQEHAPLGGFTPDADFPLIYAEKGTAVLRLKVAQDKDPMSPCVIKLEAGQRVNMVPDQAYAVVDCHSETSAREWEQKILKESKQRQIAVDVSVHGEHIQIAVHGVSAHASTPEHGVNAIVALAGLLSSNSISNASMWRALANFDTAGRGLGIESCDEVTGELTCNLGVARLENDYYDFFFDIRYPIDLTPDDLLAKCSEHVTDKWTVSYEGGMKPLYVPKDSPVIQVLTEVYEHYMGESAEAITIGGATYARAIPNAVAFGPLFPGQADLAHQKDESWSIEDYLKCIKIYADAMMRLANTL